MTLREFLSVTERYPLHAVRQAMAHSLARREPRTRNNYRALYDAISARLRLVAQKVKR